MENNIDRRVMRTKTLLIHSLSTLMKQKNIKDITVKELCELADINSDKFIQIFQKYNARNTKDFPYPLFLDIFEFVSDNAELFRVLIGPNGDISFIMKIHQLYNMYCIQTEISKLSPELSITAVSVLSNSGSQAIILSPHAKWLSL